MAFFMNASASQSSTTEESDVFESQIIEGNDGEKILSLPSESWFPRAVSRYNLPPMSAPPTVNRSFQFGVDSSYVEKSTNLPVASEKQNFGGSANIPSKKSRAKSLSFVQPTCLVFKQYQDRMAANSCCPTANTLSIWKWRTQSSACDRSNECLPCNTLCSEQPSNPYPLGTGVTIQIVNSADVSLLSCGPLVNAASSSIIGMLNTSEREYSPGRICRICHDGAGALISPCLCAGTVALIHKDCLERWLTQINRSSCEICKFEYRVERRPLPFYKVFSDSTNNKLRRSILTDMACFVGLTPLAIAAICLCLLGAMQVFQTLTTEENVKLEPAVAKAQEASRQWEAGWLIFLAVMLLLVYIIWFSCTFNSHMKTWAQWRLASFQVKLLDVKRPCLVQVEASDDVPLVPICLMMDDATMPPSSEATLNILIADSPARAQSPGSSSPGAALVDLPAQVVRNISSTPVHGETFDELLQDVPSISSTSVTGAGRVFSNTGEVAEVDGNYTVLPIILLRG